MIANDILLYSDLCSAVDMRKAPLAGDRMDAEMHSRMFCGVSLSWRSPLGLSPLSSGTPHKMADCKNQRGWGHQENMARQINYAGCIWLHRSHSNHRACGGVCTGFSADMWRLLACFCALLTESVCWGYFWLYCLLLETLSSYWVASSSLDMRVCVVCE